MGGNLNHEISIQEDPYQAIVGSIRKNELEKVRPISSGTCIYRVPDRLRRAKEEAYTPKVVSIGPMHHEESLLSTNEHKRRFLEAFLRRTSDKDLSHYAKIVKDSEDKLRDCYEETFEFSSVEFCSIVLVDAVFIVELFFSSYPDRAEVDPVEKELLPYAKHVLGEISHELLFLENQLPFFILEEFWKQVTTKPIVEFFCWYYCLNFSLEKCANLAERPLHLVDLVRKLYKPSRADPVTTPKEREFLHAPNATELHQAGVHFRAGSNKNLFDVIYRNGFLEIPKLKITDSTDSRMRNLAAFEQCHHFVHEDSYICHYLILLDHLVNTEQDVDLLVKKKIIENWLGESKDVSDMMNKLCVGINVDPRKFYFNAIFDHLEKHYNHPWNHWNANLKQNYFNTPWAVISFVAAFILLILTIIQTIATVIPWINN